MKVETNLLSLEKACKKIVPKLKELKNIKGFSKKHGLCYQNVLRIKNHSDTRYPSILKDLLKIFFNIDAEIVSMFKI